MLKAESVLIKWSPKMKKHYESKGYEFTKYGESFEVNVYDLSKGSGIEVTYICDYCQSMGKEKIMRTSFARYLKSHQKIKKDACHEHGWLKNRDVCRLTYGCDNYFQLESTKSKIIQTQMDKYGDLYVRTDEYRERYESTCIDRYGVASPMKNRDVRIKANKTVFEKYGVDNVAKLNESKEKAVITNQKRYGVDYYTQTEEYLVKKKATSFEKYGTDHPSKSDDIKQKMKETNLQRYGVEYAVVSDVAKRKTKITNLERYGFENPLQNEEVRAKANATLIKNNNVPTSSQQKSVFDTLLLSGYDVQLNHPVSSIILDVALTIDDLNIDIEYDGLYWHQDKNKDRRRDEYLKSIGWKILRIRSNRSVPTLEQLLSWIDVLVNTDREFLQRTI